MIEKQMQELEELECCLNMAVMLPGDPRHKMTLKQASSAVKSLMEHKRLVDRIRSARSLRDWDEVNMAVRELCELESEFRR